MANLSRPAKRGKASNGAAMMEERSDAFSDAVEKIIEAAEAREAASASGMFDASMPTEGHFNGGGFASTNAQQEAFSGGILTAHEIEHLGLLSASVTSSEAPACAHGSMNDEPREKAGFAAVGGDSLTLLVPMLEKHARSAANIDLIREANAVLEEEVDGGIELWSKVNLPEKIAVVRQGMSAASILLTIMTSPGVDPRVVSEDSIEACIAVMRQHLMKNVIPAITNTGHLVTSRRDSSSSPKRSMKSPPAKRLKKSTSHLVRQEQHSLRAIKKLYKPIFSSVGILLVLMERIEGLLQSVQIDDRQVLTLCSGVLSTFSMDPVAANASMCHLLQVAAIGIATTIFRKYPRHRAVVIEDLFPLMLQLPTSKRTIRTYPVRSAVDLSPQRSSSDTSTSPVRASKPQSIQAMSALILSLIQSCVVMPTVEASPETQEDTEDNPLPLRLSFGLRHCQCICNSFSSELIKRCSRKGSDGGASEFRPVLSNLIDDLLFVQLTPEYPAAEMLLLSLSSILSNDLLRASSAAGSSKSNSPTAESTYLTTALDAMGKICSAMARHLVVHREHPLTISCAADNHGEGANDEADGKEVNRCFCGRSSMVDTFMLDCDRCHAWFHGSCLGIPRDAVPEVWVCDDCRLQLMVVEHTQAFAERSKSSSKKRRTSGAGEGEQEDNIDETHIFRQLLLNYLSLLSQNTKSLSIKSSREFHISKWVRELENLRHSSDSNAEDSLFDPGLLCDHFVAQWDSAGASPLTVAKSSGASRQVDSRSLPCLSEEGNARLMLGLLATKSDMAVAFPRMLRVMVSLMVSPLAALRKLSVKAISQVIAADPKIMLQKAMRDAVSKSFHDEAISVREAAVSLVGSYVLQTPALANAFHKPLLTLLSDPGVSVRKRTVRIYRDILISNSSYRGSAVACAVMLQRAADPKEDDGVRDLIHSLFQELWLESGGSPLPLENASLSPKESTTDSMPTNLSNGGGPQEDVGDVGVVTPSESPDPNPAGSRKTSSRPLKSPLQLRSDMAAGQMVEVVRCTGTGEVLAALMKELLCGFSDADKDRKAAERRKRQAAAQRHCSHLVDALIEQLVEEELRLNSSGDCGGGKLVAIIRTIEVFAQASPALIMNHIDHILPYLKVDNKVSRQDEEAIVSATCGIVYRIAPIMEKNDIRQMSAGSIGKDLVRITKTFGAGALSSAIKALASLANHKDAEEGGSLQTKLLGLASTFYDYLSRNKKLEVEFSPTKVKTHNIHRALAVTGSICRHIETDEDSSTDWNEFLPENYEEIDPQSLSWFNVRLACYGLFSSYLAKDDLETKCAALRAMGGVFSSRPRVMLAAEQAGIIGEVMSEDSPSDLQLTALCCWRDILITEEKRVDTGEARAKMDSKEDVTVSKRISGDQDGDATLVGGVLTTHSPRLFQMTRSPNAKIRQGTVDLLGDLLRQGLINPMETVPYLFALQGDVGAPTIRSSALKLLIREGEKRPDMLRQRACAGVREACKFQREVYPNNVQVTAVTKRKIGDEVAVESIFNTVFKECIRSSRKQREGLYSSLLRLFDEEENENESKRKKANEDTYIEKLPLLSFAAQVLAHLPYSTATDPLFIIYNISCSAALHGAQLLDRLAVLMGGDGLEESNNAEDALEKAAKSKNPSRTKEASVLKETDFDLSAFAEMCAEGYSIVLLLRLKAFLRKVYSLSETRCMEFIPDGKERIVDKGIGAPDKMPIFNASFESCVKDCGKASKSNTALDKDVLVRQYSEFRRIMRSVDSRDNIMDGSGDESKKRSKKRGKKRKRTVLSDDDDSDSDYESG